jgi:hypothetical protein
LAAAVSPTGTLGRLNYDIEWRLIRAGTAVIDAGDAGGRVKVDSAGLVSTLFKVDSTYTVHYSQGLCAVDTLLDAKEGKRHRQTTVTYDRDHGRATFTERDLVKNEIRTSAQTEIPRCVHEALGGILTLRGTPLEPGQATQIPMSNGRHSAQVRVEAQEREEVTTPAGVFKTVRYEAGLMNGVIYQRNGRVFVWLTDDEKRIPVQIRVRLPFPIGTVTLQLQKEEPK